MASANADVKDYDPFELEFVLSDSRCDESVDVYTVYSSLQERKNITNAMIKDHEGLKRAVEKERHARWDFVLSLVNLVMYGVLFKEAKGSETDKLGLSFEELEESVCEAQTQARAKMVVVQGTTNWRSNVVAKLKHPHFRPAAIATNVEEEHWQGFYYPLCGRMRRYVRENRVAMRDAQILALVREWTLTPSAVTFDAATTLLNSVAPATTATATTTAAVAVAAVFKSVKGSDKPGSVEKDGFGGAPTVATAVATKPPPTETKAKGSPRFRCPEAARREALEAYLKATPKLSPRSKKPGAYGVLEDPNHSDFVPATTPTNAPVVVAVAPEPMSIESADRFLKLFDQVDAANAWVNSSNTQGSQLHFVNTGMVNTTTETNARISRLRQRLLALRESQRG